LSGREQEGERPRFLADSMHGKLSHWMRMLGYDTIYTSAGDDEIIRRSLEEGRIVLTSDVELHRGVLRRGGASILLPLGRREEQLVHIAKYLEERLRISSEEFLRVKFRYCSLCNGDLAPGRAGRWMCLSCGQEYWVGGHWKNISRTLERARSMLEGSRYG